MAKSHGYPWRGMAALALAFARLPSEGRALGLCKFDPTRLEFAGSAVDQAECLLRRVKPQGSGSIVQPLPDWLRDRVGTSSVPDLSYLARWLQTKGLSAAEVGGPVERVDLPDVRYFVIHDTSTEVAGKAFPATIDTVAWSGNRLKPYLTMRTSKQVNLVTNRMGESLTLRDYADPRPEPATKLEQRGVLPSARPRFVHVENIQPRIKPSGQTWHWQAPEVAFTPVQLERLAVLYTVASSRAGRWLVPAFHFNIDSGVTTGHPHDDPQGFDLNNWVSAVALIESEAIASAAIAPAMNAMEISAPASASMAPVCEPGCSEGWTITGYFTPVLSDYPMVGMQAIKVHASGEVIRLPAAFVKEVKMEGWGRLAEARYLGWFNSRWNLATLPLNALGQPLSTTSIATDKHVIAHGCQVTIPGLPEPYGGRLFKADDVGSAIKVKHIDVYTGEGKDAQKDTYRVTRKAKESARVCVR